MDNLPQIRKKGYLKEVFRFYFKPNWQSAVLTTFYLFFFSYFAVFYIGNVWLAIKFIWYTMIHSGSLLGLSYLFWGVLFLITLIVPFSVSVYALILLYEIWLKDWEKKDKVLGTILLIISVPVLIILTDEIVRVAASRDVLREFSQLNSLNIKGK
ncbi:MAG: hypothetical protein HYW71_00135 [Candidatus Niyogibacteria bacterium]|nr:hypothetical protein [Candidatus Niyogibacteria bacterium]